jgi:tRNA G18 (ribose-2'-O)-methylase SpoU
MYIILHNIRSAYNVGAIFRTADATAVKKIFLTGYTPTPTDRFGRVQEEIKKTSLGASEIVPWQQDEFIHITQQLRTKGVMIVAVEQTAQSRPITEFNMEKENAFVFGNEVTGIEEDELSHVDAVIELPMLGKKESLNVSVAAGVVMYYEVFART